MSPRSATAPGLAERYGEQSRRPWWLIALAVVVALAGLVWLGWAAWFHSHPRLQAEVSSYEVVSDHEVRTKLEIRPADDEVTGTCLVRATAVDHSIVGEKNVRIDRAAARSHAWISVRTERRATSVETLRCRAD